MNLDKEFLDIAEAGLVNFLGIDSAQAPEILMNTAPLFAWPAVKLFFNESGDGFPGSEVRGKRWAEEGNDGRGCRSRNVHRATVRPYKQ